MTGSVGPRAALILSVHVTIALVAVAPATLRGQVLPGEIGSRLRVTVANQWELVGTFLGWRDDKLVLRRADLDTIAIDRSAIQTVEFSKGRHGHFLVGLLIGGAAGAGLGAASASGSSHCGPDTMAFSLCGGSWVVPGAIVGGVGGLVVGGVVGALVQTERWTRITPTVAVGSVAGRATRTLALGIHVPW